MHRNLLLFVCFCLGASLLVGHFHRRAITASALPQPAASQSLNALPISTGAIPVDELAVTEPKRDSDHAIVPESPISSAPVVAEEIAVEKDKYELLRELSAWAAKDPEAALAEAMKLPEGEERTEALTAVCFGLAQADPAEAVNLAGELHLDQTPGAIMEDLVQQWAAADLTSSLTWAANQPAGAARDQYTTRVAFILSQTAPSDAAALVMKQIPSGPAQDEAIMTVLHQWANQNIVAAATWANQLPGTALQERVVSELNGILDYQHALAHP
jgi:hypothetical protein